MRDRVTISIESNLKRAYEDLFGKEYADLLDEAIRKKLQDSNRIEAIEAVIKIVDQEQNQRRQQIFNLKLDLEKTCQKKPEDQKEQELAELREQKFQKDKKSFLNMVKTGGPNWSYVMREYYFERKFDAERYWHARIKQELETKT